MYTGRLIAKDGKIQLLRESMHTVAAAKAFATVEPGNAVKSQTCQIKNRG
jgi:hypothetical protein